MLRKPHKHHEEHEVIECFPMTAIFSHGEMRGSHKEHAWNNFGIWNIDAVRPEPSAVLGTKGLVEEWHAKIILWGLPSIPIFGITATWEVDNLAENYMS